MRRSVLGRLNHAVNALTTVRGAVLVAERDSGEWQGSGDRSFEASWGRTSRTSPRTAAAQVRQADELQAVPAVAAAVTAGRIGLEHAAAIGQLARTGTPAQQDVLASPTTQAELIELAEQQDGGTFDTTLTRWAATIDPPGLDHDHENQRARRYLHVAETRSGTFIKGRLDTIAGRRLTLALEAVSPRPAADDDRDHGQRCADAIDAMAGQILSRTDTKPGGHVPPQITMILTEATWVAARADRDRRRRARSAATGRSADGGRAPEDGAPRVGMDVTAGSGRGDGAAADTDAVARVGAVAGAADGANAGAGAGAVAGAADGANPGASADVAVGADVTAGAGAGAGAPARAVDGVPDLRYAPATLEDGTPVPLSELAAAMCDCEITRLVIDADGVPLDLGRSQRVFTGPQRRAIIARDRRCAWPSCGAYARWCEVHHLRWWERDAGPTSVDNGVLVCSFHHHEVHRRDLSITRIGRQAGDRATAEGTDIAPGASPPAFAPMAYRFRDPDGRVVGEPSVAVRPRGNNREPTAPLSAMPCAQAPTLERLLVPAPPPITGSGPPIAAATSDPTTPERAGAENSSPTPPSPGAENATATPHPTSLLPRRAQQR
jgi:hypothetical protein